MKSIYVLVFVFFVQQALACTCYTEQLLSNASTSDFVAEVEIIDISPDPMDDNYYDIDIQIIDLYKGESIASLKLNSSLRSGCSLYTEKGSKWLVFAKINKKGDLSFGYCSGSKQIDRKFDLSKYPDLPDGYAKKIKRAREVLSDFRDLKLSGLSSERFYTSSRRECLRNFSGVSIDGYDKAFYKLKVNIDSKIEEVIPLLEFSNKEVNEQLRHCILEFFNVYPMDRRDQLSMPTHVLVGLYYKPSIGKNQSYIRLIRSI